MLITIFSLCTIRKKGKGSIILLGGICEAYGGAWRGNPDEYEDDWSGIQPDEGAPRLDVRTKPDGGRTFGSAPCEDATGGNCITGKTHHKRLVTLCIN